MFLYVAVSPRLPSRGVLSGNRLIEISEELPTTLLLPALLLPLVGLLREQIHDIKQRRVVCKYYKHVLPRIELDQLSHSVRNLSGVAIPAFGESLVEWLVPHVIRMDTIHDSLSGEPCTGTERGVGVGRRPEDFGERNVRRGSNDASVVATVGSEEDECVRCGTDEGIQVANGMLV